MSRYFTRFICFTILTASLLSVKAMAAATPSGKPPATPVARPTPPGSTAIAMSPAAARALQSIPWAGPEPTLRWEWDPVAYEPLAHPVGRDFGWRFQELRRKDLPDVARARLNLELAFLGMAPNAIPRADSLGAAKRLREARRLYGRLLAQSPGRGEYLVDLGDLYRLGGSPDSALIVYRQAWATEHPPSRLWSRLANAELENLESRGDSTALARFRDVRRAGVQYFLRPAPEDSLLASRYFYDAARFRMDIAVLESYADRRLHPEAYQNAGPDSTFALMSRELAAETRRLAGQAANYDTSYAEAYGLIGTLATGQAYLPIAAQALLARTQAATEDSLAKSLLRLALDRGTRRRQDITLGADCLGRCVALEPGRYPRVLIDQARLALLLGEFDIAGGLWRAMLTQQPGIIGHAEELYTVYRLEGALPPRKKNMVQKVLPRIVAAQRLERALDPLAISAPTAPLLALLGWSRCEQNKVDEALTSFRAAAGRDSLEWRARLNLAIDAIHNLNPAGAVDHLRVAGQEFNAMDDPARSRYCSTVGLLLWARGSHEDARRWMAEARRFDPRNTSADLMDLN